MEVREATMTSTWGAIAGSSGTTVEEGGLESGSSKLARVDLLATALLSCWVVVTRLPYLHDFALMGKDGPLYIQALALDRFYAVPMPGNLGYVLLGKLSNLVLANPVHAYLAVNILLTCLGVSLTYLFSNLVMSRPLAAATAFAMACNPILWWHGAVLASYPVWLAVLPAIGWFGLRYVRGRAFGDLLGATISLGIGMIMRPDLLAFGTPLWFGCLVLGQAKWREWAIAIAILAVACSFWFFGTAWVLGGVDIYLDRVRAKSAGDAEGFSFRSRGLVEGLLRNGTKYSLFLVWASGLFFLPFAISVVGRLRTLPQRWRGTLLALLWVGPSWYFSFFIFAGNAGLIFPFLPLLYVGAAHGVSAWLGHGRTSGKPVAVMAVLGLLGGLQFVATPLLRETDQRQVILNVTFFRHTGAAIRAKYNYNLDDYGIDPSLASVSRQIMSPEPIPILPPKN